MKPITAAIYARRSKEQDDAEDETKSVNRQVENARVFATAKGWTVLDQHIYIDDGISGASSLAHLRAKAQMLNAIMSVKTPPFDVLICQAADRFSRRDGDESFTELKTIAKAGVQVWFYSDGTASSSATFEARSPAFSKGSSPQNIAAPSVKRPTRRTCGKPNSGTLRGAGFRLRQRDRREARRAADQRDRGLVVRRIFDLRAAGVG